MHLLEKSAHCLAVSSLFHCSGCLQGLLSTEGLKAVQLGPSSPHHQFPLPGESSLLLSRLPACSKGNKATHAASRMASGFPSMGLTVPVCTGSGGFDLASPPNRALSRGPALTDRGQTNLSNRCGLPESISDSGICLINPFITGHSGKEVCRVGIGNHSSLPARLLCPSTPPPPHPSNLLSFRCGHRAVFLWGIQRLNYFNASKAPANGKST